uniref:t-SNARE coiled-coil homology domain-containing protein n=1 Tax=Globisporangium ultimum (strain ATCC 200006 / CBS 805.95 / DAOM BR144) TaxID=431595 RepID=K3WHM7_GLOUD
MTETFNTYREDFELYRDDAAKDIKGIANAPTKAAREELVNSAQGNISEAERYFRILESESRAGDAQDRRQMHQQLRTLKSQIDKLKSSLDRAKLVADSQQRLNEKPDNLSAKDNMIRYQKRIDRTGDHLDDAQGIIAETQAIAANITGNLQQQREQLINVRGNVDDTREDAKEAGEHLNSLKRKHQIKIFSLYFIIFGLSVGIIASIISKFA